MTVKPVCLFVSLLLAYAAAEPFFINPADFQVGEVITNDLATLSYIPSDDLLIPQGEEQFTFSVVRLQSQDGETPVIGYREFFMGDVFDQNFWSFFDVLRIDFFQDMFSVDLLTSGPVGMKIFDRSGAEIDRVGEFGDFPPGFLNPMGLPVDAPAGSGGTTLSYFSPLGNIAAVEIVFEVSDGPGVEVFGVGFSAIPEPSTLGLIAVSLIAFLKLRRFSKR